jgi:small-conductance mechanosensitive channel
MKEALSWLKSHLDTELYLLGKARVTPLSVVVLLITVLTAVLLARLARRGIRRFFQRRGGASEGAAYAIGRIAQILLIGLGVVIGLQNIGVDLSTLAALGAILGVGIGFGLQGLAQNFVAGVNVLVERPIEKGDVIRLGDMVGVVDEIKLRVTRITTRDHVAVIVPNSELTNQRVINLSKPDTHYRVRLPVGVAYGSDTRKVERALLEVAAGDPNVLAEPAPLVFFRDFGDSSLDFELAVWLDDPLNELQVTSALRFAIDDAFRAKGITIPFPQRHLHLEGGLPDPGQRAS